MKRAATAMALLALAGCMGQPRGEPRTRNLTYGIFYDAFRPESSRTAELRARLDRPVAPEIDEAFDVSTIRAPRQYAEVPENYDLRDWREGVLLRADADLLRKMKADTETRTAVLESRLKAMNGEPAPLQKGRIEPVRFQLGVERLKLEAIDERLASID